MKYLFILILMFSCVSNVYAQWVVSLDKATGKILMSANSFNPDTCIAVMKSEILSCGLKLKDVEIKIIADAEYDQIVYDTITVSNQEKENQRQQNRQNKKNAMKQKLGFSEQEWRDLLEAIGVSR